MEVMTVGEGERVVSCEAATGTLGRRFSRRLGIRSLAVGLVG